jgi:hypothetical protein
MRVRSGQSVRQIEPSENVRQQSGEFDLPHRDAAQKPPLNSDDRKDRMEGGFVLTMKGGQPS